MSSSRFTLPDNAFLIYVAHVMPHVWMAGLHVKRANDNRNTLPTTRAERESTREASGRAGQGGPKPTNTEAFAL